MHTNNYSNIEIFDKVIAKIKWHSFFCPIVYNHIACWRLYVPAISQLYEKMANRLSNASDL